MGNNIKTKFIRTHPCMRGRYQQSPEVLKCGVVPDFACGAP